MSKNNENATTSCEVMTFQFSESKQPVRNLLIENKPWFVAKDVCDVLGLKDTNMSIKSLDDDEKLTQKIFGSGQNRDMWVISESGLYALILRSNKPHAKTFRKWITSEVIPALLKKGYYSMGKSEAGGFVDARNIPFHTKMFNGYPVRYISFEDNIWFSVNDLNKSLHSATPSNQIAKKLNAIECLAIKIWLFGNTHPAWFTNIRGTELILSGSRINNRELRLTVGGLCDGTI